MELTFEHIDVDIVFHLLGLPLFQDITFHLWDLQLERHVFVLEVVKLLLQLLALPVQCIIPLGVCLWLWARKRLWSFLTYFAPELFILSFQGQQLLLAFEQLFFGLKSLFSFIQDEGHICCGCIVWQGAIMNSSFVSKWWLRPWVKRILCARISLRCNWALVSAQSASLVFGAVLGCGSVLGAVSFDVWHIAKMVAAREVAVAIRRPQLHLHFVTFARYFKNDLFNRISGRLLHVRESVYAFIGMQKLPQDADQPIRGLLKAVIFLLYIFKCYQLLTLFVFFCSLEVLHLLLQVSVLFFQVLDFLAKLLLASEASWYRLLEDGIQIIIILALNHINRSSSRSWDLQIMVLCWPSFSHSWIKLSQ